MTAGINILSEPLVNHIILFSFIFRIMGESILEKMILWF